MTPSHRFCGLTRSQPPTSMTVLKSEAPNWVYRYGTHPGRWTQILSGGGEQRGGRAAAAAAPSPPAEPQPRYAHQVVYDPVRKMVFLHGGNAGLVAPSGDGDEEDDEDADGDVRMVEGRGDAEKDGGREREKRLDDFWCMTLQRCGSFGCTVLRFLCVMQSRTGGGHSEGDVSHP
jgi:hypothetical protein